MAFGVIQGVGDFFRGPASHRHFRVCLQRVEGQLLPGEIPR